MTSRHACVLALLAVTVVPVALTGCGGDEAASPQTTAAVDTAAPETSTETAPETTTPPEATTGEATTTEAAPSETATTAAKPTPIEITVVGAAPKGGIQRVDVKKGERVVLVVRSDVADEIHLHGYDLSTDVDAGGVARLAFVASIPGRFEVELENRGVQIADVTVSP
jgi:cytoskeletal protein RodZ